MEGNKFIETSLEDSPLIRLDAGGNLEIGLKYATADNFTGRVVYPQGFSAFLHRDLKPHVEEALAYFKERGLGVTLFDAYRPNNAQIVLARFNPQPEFTLPPFDRVTGKGGSNHTRGMALDGTLFDLASGSELVMPTAFDDFSEKASPIYRGPEVLEEALRNRDHWLAVWDRVGFEPLGTEWFHVQSKLSYNYPFILIPQFEEGVII